MKVKKPSVEIMSMFLALGNTEQDEMQTSSSDYFGIKRVADNGLSVLAPLTDSKKVNLANSARYCQLCAVRDLSFMKVKKTLS